MSFDRQRPLLRGVSWTMDRTSPKILLPSIIDPTVHRGGAETVTRAFLKLLQRDPLNARIEKDSARGWDT